MLDEFKFAILLVADMAAMKTIVQIMNSDCMVQNTTFGGCAPMSCFWK